MNLTGLLQIDRGYHNAITTSSNSVIQFRSTAKKVDWVRVVEMVPVLVVEIVPPRLPEIVPVAVVEMVPVLVVEIVPDLVVEIVPVFPNAGTEAAMTRIPAQTMDLQIFMVLLLVLKTSGAGRL